MNRWINLFRKRRLDAEIDEELQFHFEARTRDNLDAGMTPEEARGDAARRFGGRLLAREGSRDADIVVWMETFAQDVRYAIRGLRKNPGVTSIALLSLGLAIGANTAIFSIVNGVLLRALPYKDSGRIAMLWTTNRLNGAMEQNNSLLNMNEWRARNHSFDAMAAYRESDGTISIGASDDAQWGTYAWVTGNFFELLGRAPVLGRVFDEQEFATRRAVVVLSHRFWQREFHRSPQAIGRVINLGGQDFTVIGVMPEDFWFPSREVELWAPVSLHPQWLNYHADRHWRVGAVFGRLKQHTSLQQAQTEMRGIAGQLEREYPDANRDQGINVVPLQIQVNGKSIPFMLAILFGAVIFVLLIACANVANLLLARGVVRSREIALRAALGAGRGRIARQLLTESVLLSCAAGLLGLPIAAWSMSALIAVAPSSITRLDEVRMDGTVLVFTFCLSLLCGVLFGLAPTIQISGRAPAGSLHWNNRYRTGGRSARILRSTFVVCQFALALVLLAGAGLLLRSLAAVQSVDSGFGNRNVLTAYLRFNNALPQPRRAALYHQALERVEQLPGVHAAGAASAMFWGGEGGKFGLRAVEGQATEPRQQWSPLTWSTVCGNYFQALGVPLLRGRFFSDRDRQDSPPVVLVNQTMARRYWPGQDAVGKRIKGFDARGHNDEWVTVIGVVKDVHSGGLERAPMAQIFEPQSQSLDATENLVVSTVSSRIADTVRNTIHELDRTAVISNFSTVSQALHQQSAQRRFQTLLLSTFAVLALALAGAGIFGMMHYSVAQRTQEIGIRMALGARRSNVLTMVLSEGAALAAAGVGLGIAGSMVLLRTISSLLFGVTPQDPVTFALVSLTLTATAVAGCYVPARRATRVDPMAALRSE